MSFFVPVRDAIDVIDETFLVPPHQVSESVAITPENAPYQGPVVELLAFGHCSVRLLPRKV